MLDRLERLAIPYRRERHRDHDSVYFADPDGATLEIMVPDCVIRFVFSVEDLARTRFAISPMWEAIRSLAALRDPSTAALHLPWLRGLSGRLGGIALEPVVALIPPRGYAPDFLTPRPPVRSAGSRTTWPHCGGRR